MVVVLATAVASFLYAGGSLQLKRSMSGGAAAFGAVAITNFCMALWSLPLLLWSIQDWPHKGIPWDGVWGTLCAGLALFVGRILAVKALEWGDLSMVGPLLGLKTLLIASLATLMGQLEVSWIHWLSAGLAFGGVTLLQRGQNSTAKKSKRAVVYALGASVFFAATDLLVVQVRHDLGATLVTPILFMTVALMALCLGKLPKAPAETRRSLWAGSAIIGFQTTVIVFLIALTGEAVIINIVYASRALWTVVMDRWFNASSQKSEIYGFRFVGATFVMAAVMMVASEMRLKKAGGELPSDDVEGHHHGYCECCTGAYPL